MGNNVDLCQMLDAPSKVQCSRCRAFVNTYFDDYDIDCGNPNPGPGIWSLRVNCPECGHEWRWEVTCQAFEKGTHRTLTDEVKADIEESVRVSAGGGIPLEGFIALVLYRIYGYLEMDPGVTRGWFK